MKLVLSKSVHWISIAALLSRQVTTAGSVRAVSERKIAESCPLPLKCFDPCPENKCSPSQTCVARETFITLPGGTKCPDCPVFQACVVTKPGSVPCGSTQCPPTEVCCNTSCGICTPPDGLCTLSTECNGV